MNLPVKYKVTLISFMIVVMAVSGVGGYFYYLYSQSVIRQVEGYQSEYTNFINNYIGLIEENVENLTTSMILNQSFQRVLSWPTGQFSLLSEQSNDLNASINLEINALVSNNYISYISVFTENGYSYSYSKGGLCTSKAYSSLRNMDTVKTAIRMNGTQYWTTLTNDGNGILINNQEPKLTMLQSILNTNTCKPSGMLIVCIDWNTIWSFVPRSNEDTYIAVDHSGKVISYVNPSDALSLKPQSSIHTIIPNYESQSSNSIVQIGGISYFFTIHNVSQTEDSIIGLTPIRSALQNVRSILPAMLLFILICIIFSFGISILTASLITKPIQKLVDSIHSVKSGNFKNKVNFSYTDEIGKLGNAYNDMIDELNRQINRVLKLEIRNRESEIKMLQEKMNPHFLYNTLDSIYIKAMSSGDNDTAEMIYSLSNILRLTLNCGNEFFTVSDEINLIDNYLSLQKIRYKERLDYSISVDESMQQTEIPKLILQPFIENAISHGMRSGNAVLLVEIYGFYREHTLEFVIRDNGNGIKPERLADILNNRVQNQGTKERGFAIFNLKERLKIYYGDAQSFKINSECGKGTEVRIVIPDSVETGLMDNGN